MKNVKIKENHVPMSLREHGDKKILFRLFNPKRDKSKSYSIYEKSRLSDTLSTAFQNQYRKIDIEYDTTANNRFKKANLLVDVPMYLDKNKKSLYLELINSNKEYIKNHKVPQSILDNQKYFEQIISKL